MSLALLLLLFFSEAELVFVPLVGFLISCQVNALFNIQW